MISCHIIIPFILLCHAMIWPLGISESTSSASSTTTPTSDPSLMPNTSVPSAIPSSKPIISTSNPSHHPLAEPTNIPSTKPTVSPTSLPTSLTSSRPSSPHPSTRPSARPSVGPSLHPSDKPTRLPSMRPTSLPSSKPTYKPSLSPNSPSTRPTFRLSKYPSIQPTKNPSSKPLTGKPSSSPHVPSVKPTYLPSNKPTYRPSFKHTTRPSTYPSLQLLLPTRPPSIRMLSSQTPTIPVISVSSSLQLEMGLVFDVMDMINQQRFESIVKAWLDAIYSVYNPAVTGIAVHVISQHLNTKRRLSTAASAAGQLFLELRLSGFRQSLASTDTANIQFRDELFHIFHSDINTATLVAMIQAKAANDILYVYFKNVSKVSLPTIVQPPPSPQKSDLIGPLIGGIVGGVFGALFLGLAVVFVVKRRRRRRRDKESVESNLVSLPIDHFHYSPDTDPSRNADRNMHDETSSDGTFKTLENLHKDAGSYFSNVDPDILDPKVVDDEIPYRPIRGVIGDLFETSDGYSVSLDSNTGGTPSELDNGSLLNKSETSSDHVSISSMSRVQRNCIAPPGRLGIVIDSSRYGPIIHEVKSRSPLENMVFVGDRIVAVDGIDTTRMTASEVTKIMALKADSRRKITVTSSVH